MLVLAPAACILSGIALSQAFDVFTRSIKFQLPHLSDHSQVDVSFIFLTVTILTSYVLLLVLLVCFVQIVFFIIKAGEGSSENVVPNDSVKADKTEDTSKERTSKRSKKKEKEPVEKPLSKSQIKKRLSVLPLETSVIAIILLVLLGAFYVVIS